MLNDSGLASSAWTAALSSEAVARINRDLVVMLGAPIFVGTRLKRRWVSCARCVPAGLHAVTALQWTGLARVAPRNAPDRCNLHSCTHLVRQRSAIPRMGAPPRGKAAGAA